MTSVSVTYVATANNCMTVDSCNVTRGQLWWLLCVTTWSQLTGDRPLTDLLSWSGNLWHKVITRSAAVMRGLDQQALVIGVQSIVGIETAKKLVHA